jgi:hypothetical protein
MAANDQGFALWPGTKGFDYSKSAIAQQPMLAAAIQSECSTIRLPPALPHDCLNVFYKLNQNVADFVLLSSITIDCTILTKWRNIETFLDIIIPHYVLSKNSDSPKTATLFTVLRLRPFRRIDLNHCPKTKLLTVLLRELLLYCGIEFVYGYRSPNHFKLRSVTVAANEQGFALGECYTEDMNLNERA